MRKFKITENYEQEDAAYCMEIYWDQPLISFTACIPLSGRHAENAFLISLSSRILSLAK
jgi:hypothetical protein